MLHARDAKQQYSVNIYSTLTRKYILVVSICGLFHEIRLVISAAVDFFGGKALDNRICGQSLLKINLHNFLLSTM